MNSVITYYFTLFYAKSFAAIGTKENERERVISDLLGFGMCFLWASVTSPWPLVGSAFSSTQMNIYIVNFYQDNTQCFYTVLKTSVTFYAIILLPYGGNSPHYHQEYITLATTCIYCKPASCALYTAIVLPAIAPLVASYLVYCFSTM